MADVSPDNSADLGNTTATSLSAAYTVGSGNDRVLEVDVVGDTATDAITGATFNSVAMVLVAKVDPAAGGSTRWIYKFILINPASGSHNVVVSANATVFIAVHAASYAGCRQFSQPHVFNTGVSGGATSLTISVTTTVDRCWLTGSLKNDNGTGTAGSGTTVRQTSAVGGMTTCDSNGVITPAGSASLSVSAGASTAWSGIVSALAPAIAPQTYDWPNPIGLTASHTVKQMVDGVRGTDLSLFFPPVPLPAGKSILFPNPTLSMDWGKSRGYEHATPTWLYTPYFPLPTDALVFINAVDKSVYVNKDSIDINTNLNEQPNACTLKFNGFQPTNGQNIQIGLGSLDPDRMIFAGTITNVKQVYDGAPVWGSANIAWVCDCIDYTYQANRRRPTGIFINVSATTVFNYLITNFTSGLDAGGVPSGLPAITISFNGDETFAQCLTNICNLIVGYKWKFSYTRSLRVFIVDTGTPPTLIDMNNTTTQMNPGFEYDVDITQLRNRVVGKGPSQNLLSPVLDAETILPIKDPSLFSAAGGYAYLGPTPITYAGVQTTEIGTFVGPGATPSSPLIATVIGGAGVDSGFHQYEFTFVTAIGESSPSPVANATTGQVAAPSAAPALSSFAGPGMSQGTYQYEVTNVTSTGGETTGSPASTIITDQIANPTDAPYNVVPVVTGYTWPSGTTTFLFAIRYVIYNAYGTWTTIHGPTTSRTLNFGDVWTTSVSGLMSSDARVSSIYIDWSSDSGATWFNLGGYPNTPGGSYTVQGIFGVGIGEVISVNTATFTKVLVALAAGPDGTASRRIYRTTAGGSQLKLVATIADNTTLSYLDAVADGSLGANIPVSNTATANQVSLSAILAGPTGTTARKIYRTAAGGGQAKLLATLADNVTTTYTDSLADSTLGANAPLGDTSGLATPLINGAGFYTSASVVFSTNGAATNANTASPVFTSASYSFVSADVGAYLYIKSGTNWTPGRYLIASVAAGAATLVGACASVASPTNATWGVDYSGLSAARYAFTDMAIGAANAATFTSAANPVGVNFIGNVIAVSGSLGFISQRVIVLSVAGTVATCDKLIGTVSSTAGIGNLGGAAVATYVLAGATSAIIASAGPFSATGGWALTGSNYIRYTGLSGNSLIGIPASGVGSINASISYNTTIAAVPSLTGCVGVLASTVGTNVILATVLNDTASQAAMAAAEGGDGVHEFVFTDTSVLTLAALTAEAQSILDLFSTPSATVTQSARDINTVAGRLQSVSLISPFNIVISLQIQSVKISHIGTEIGQYPLYTATSSNIKYTLQDLIRQLGSLV